MLADLNRFRYRYSTRSLNDRTVSACKVALPSGVSPSRSEREMAPDTKNTRRSLPTVMAAPGAGLTNELHDQRDGLCRGPLDHF